MDNNNYKVIISKPNEVSDVISGKLASLFKISLDKARNILQQNEFVVKKQTDKQTAEKFHKAITAAGINCRIEEILPVEETELPTIEEIATPKNTPPLIDPTRNEIAPLTSKPLNFSLEDRPAEKTKSEDSNEKEFASIDPANYCPECGTIRASADSNCVHCGYDPEEIKSQKRKSIISKFALGLIALIVTLLVAFPFYQYYNKRMQIQTDLKLAFDTRNKVTEFIKRTNFWPNQNIDADLPKSISNRSIESVIVREKAVITVTLRKSVLEELDLNSNRRTLIFAPNILKGRIVWNCLKGTLVNELRPEICQQKER